MTDHASRFRLRACSLACLSLASAPLAAWSASPAGMPNIPNAGSLMQQVTPQGEAPLNTNPGLSVPTPKSTSPTDTTPITVTHIELSGNTAFDTITLHNLVADAEGKTLTLGQLDARAQRIADYYHQHGYLLAQAYFPPQSIENGTVRIAIVEARYGEIKLENRSRVRDGLLESMLAPIQSGAPVTQAELDRSLLLLSDAMNQIPRTRLAPGQTPGTTDLSVEADSQSLMSGQVGIDNEGDRYTGRVRGSADLTLNNPLHQGDALDISAMSSGHGMTWGDVSYRLTLDGSGTQAGVSYSALDYHLGDSLASLDAHGTASVASVWLMHPFIRSQTLNLRGRLEYDHRQLDDDVEASAIHDARHINTATASLIADRSDTLLGGGIISATLGISHGVLAFDNADAQAADAATANTQGGYTLWSAALSRLQRLTDATQLYLALNWQHANRNVDSSQQWLLGGPGTIRGYPDSTLAGASGWLMSAELRHDFVMPLVGTVQGKVFIDSGEVTVNADPWQAGTNHAHLTGAGVGLDWNGPRQWAASVQLAMPVGNTPELAGERPSAQVWAQLAKRF